MWVMFLLMAVLALLPPTYRWSPLIQIQYCKWREKRLWKRVDGIDSQTVMQWTEAWAANQKRWSRAHRQMMQPSPYRPFTWEELEEGQWAGTDVEATGKASR